MRLKLRLPLGKSDEIPEPTVCPYANCGGAFCCAKWRPSHCGKPPCRRDSPPVPVSARRRTLRVYSADVNHMPTSERVKGVAVMRCARTVGLVQLHR